MRRSAPCPVPMVRTLQAAVQRELGDVGAMRAVQVDHRHAVIGQEPGEKARLGGEIGLHRVVIIQVVLRQVGEARRLQAHAFKPALVEAVGRGLHRGMGDAGGGGLRPACGAG